MSKIKTKSLPMGSKILVFIFLFSGTAHLVNPGVFEALIPPFLGNESTSALLGPKFTALVLMVIWVGNWWYAIDVTSNLESSWFLILGSWLRLPLQIPLIQWALRTPIK
jgi:uncharacterized membrane protein